VFITATGNGLGLSNKSSSDSQGIGALLVALTGYIHFTRRIAALYGIDKNGRCIIFYHSQFNR
jgi:hypothetical protein